MKPLFDDGHEDVDRDRDPDLSLDRVLGSAEERLDSEMLLDPLEEELHLPAAFVERTNRGWRKLEVVRHEDQCLARFWILEADAPEMLRVALARKRAVECDGLVADDACKPVTGRRVDAADVRGPLRPRDERCTRLIEHEQSVEVEICTVHHVEG